MNKSSRIAPLFGWLAPAWLEPLHPRRLLVLIGGLLIAALIVAASVTIWTTREKELRASERELTRLSLTLAEQTARTLQGVDLILLGLTDWIKMDGIATPDDFRRLLGTKEVNEMLAAKVHDVPQIDAISIIDDRGDLVNFSRFWPVPQINVSDRDYFVAHRDVRGLGPFISQPVRNRGTGTWTIYLARRVSGPNGEFLGLILGAMETRSFEEFYRAVSPGSEGTISLFRRDGTLLARHPDSTPEIGRSFGAQPLFKLAQANGEPAVVRTSGSAFDGLARIMAPHVVRGFPLLVNVTNTESAVLASWRRQTYVILGITAAAILLILISGWLLIRQLDLQARMMRSQTEREQADRARAVAEAASRAKSSFLANMSHELRTPLNAIIGFTDMLAARYFGPLNDKQAEYVHDIGVSGHHLLGLINTVLDMSKIEAGRNELREEPVALAAIFDEAATFLRVHAEQGHIALGQVVPTDLPPVRADRRALLQVIINLLTNAVKFTPPGGTVSLRAAAAPDGALTIDVADTGVGIATADLVHIFEPFQRADARLSRKHGGSGLGLSISRMLIEQHGGTLTLTSKPGIGTTVTIRLPAERVLRGGVAAGAAPSTARAVG